MAQNDERDLVEVLTHPAADQLAERIAEQVGEAVAAEVGQLREAVEQLTSTIDELANPPARAQLRGLTVQVPLQDFEPPLLVPAAGRRPALVTWPARPTLAEWLGVVVSARRLPKGVKPERAENL